MTSLTSRYADWKAPDEDGQLLIWPPAAGLVNETRENHRRLAERASFATARRIRFNPRAV